MKVNTKDIGGEITKDNDTYVLEDNNLLEHMGIVLLILYFFNGVSLPPDCIIWFISE